MKFRPEEIVLDPWEWDEIQVKLRRLEHLEEIQKIHNEAIREQMRWDFSQEKLDGLLALGRAIGGEK